VAPYHFGKSSVKTMFIAATTASGRNARKGDTVARSSAASGSLKCPLP